MIDAELDAARKVPWARTEDQSVMVLPQQNRLVLLNQTATAIWQGLIAGNNDSELILLLKKKYSICSEQAENDVANILNIWRKAGLFNNNINSGNIKRWHKDEPLAITPTSLTNPLYSIKYQLNTYIFVIDYYNENLFKSVHNVLIHLKVNSGVFDQNSTPHDIFQIYFKNNCYFSEKSKQIRKVDTLDELVETVQWTLIEKAYQNHDWLTVFHASALGRDNGDAIAFVAERGSGKSTLNRYLQSHGFTYLSDDIVPINYDNELLPIPMSQRFKQGSWDILNLDDYSHHKIYTRLEGQFVKYVPPLTGKGSDWSKSWPLKAIIYPKFDYNQYLHTLDKLGIVESMHLLCQSGSVFGGVIDQSQLDSIVSMINCIPSYAICYSNFNSKLADKIASLPD